MSADNLPDKSRNLSSYIMECGSSEKFELLLEKFQLILWRTFFRNICCNIFMKQLGNIRGKRNTPPAFTTVQLIDISFCPYWSVFQRVFYTYCRRFDTSIFYKNGAVRHGIRQLQKSSSVTTTQILSSELKCNAY